MKKIILTALIAVSLISSAFAADKNKVNVLVKNSFYAEYGNAKDVQWEAKDAYITATFVMDETKMQAHFEKSGALIGTSQEISLNSLPASAKRAFAKKYSNYTVTEALKFEKQDETAYFVSAKNDNAKVILKVVDGQISVFK